MDKLENAVKLCVERCGTKTISEFRKEALRNLSGTAYASYSTSEKERLMLMFCVTSPDQIRLMEHALENAEWHPEPINWDATSIAHIFFQTAKGPGLTYHERRNKNGDRTTLLLCATNPDLISLLENIFKLSAR